MMQRVHTLIIGSGAAGLCCAVRLKELLNRNAENAQILIATEGLNKGTSINTGSDKQTYYKLSLGGNQQDSVYDVAQTLFDGGSMHGDIALIEAAYSARCFYHLVQLGVPFPTDKYGQFAGYKTDHDPRQRATSTGPYTSRDMCLALQRRVRELQIPVQEKMRCIELLAANNRCTGAVFLNEHDERETILAQNTVFAVGGPGDMYQNSVYPPSQRSSIGLALAIGAEAHNLQESQFGLASIKHRWNVSGTYMQCIPRFISTDENGNDVQEFLTDSLANSELYTNIFLKGYQWPFDVKKLNGSSIIDLLVHKETVEKHRRVFLDFRQNPTGLDFDSPSSDRNAEGAKCLSDEAYSYLEKCGALEKQHNGTPIERLAKMNPLAIEMYKEHGIDLYAEPLEIAVCAQHNNGGLAGTIWWESTNIKRLFPIGEVNGSHGVARPGGAALNAGQVGAFRAAEYIAGKCITEEGISTVNSNTANSNTKIMNHCQSSIIHHQLLMSRYGGMVRQLPMPAVNELPLMERMYLDAIRFSALHVGSRGSALVMDNGDRRAENEEYREKVLVSWYNLAADEIEHRWEQCRPIPDDDLWFETVWKEYRKGVRLLIRQEC